MNLNTKVAFIITLILDIFLLLLGAATIVFLKVGGVIVFFIEFLIIRFFHRKIYAFLTSKGTVDESITIKTNDVANAYSNTDVENNLGVEIVKYCDYSDAVHQVRKQKTDSIIKHKRFIYITTTILISSIIIGSLLWNTKPYSNKFSGYLYPICENGLYGYIDSVGNKIIEPHFLWGSTFSNGKAMVVVDTIYKEIDDSISYFIGASDIVQKKYRLLAKYGYIDRSGEFVLSPNYVCFVTVPKGDKV